MHAPSAIIASAAAIICIVSASARQEPQVSPRAEAQRALEKLITVEFSDARLPDVVEFLENYTGLVVRPMWLDDRHTDGLTKETEISVDVREGTVRDLLEEVLEQASDSFSESTWQLSPRGELQIGPRSRLNRYREIEFYDVRDLLIRLPDFTDAPDLNIDAAMSQGRGGGGGNIFEFNDEEEVEDELGEQKDLAEQLVRLIHDLVEPEQWQENGGEGGQIRIQDGLLIIRAPEYIHRQLRGSVAAAV